MAQRRRDGVTQNAHTITVARWKFSDLISEKSEVLKRTDLRVLLILFSVLPGYDAGDKRDENYRRKEDPRNFVPICIEDLADKLGISTKKFKDSLLNLEAVDLIECNYIGNTREKGYRFLF